MTNSISVYAGAGALKKIRENGLQASQFQIMAGASGGPKWFTLFGLDKYLFGEFFGGRTQPIHTIGSSAGSWRMACFAQRDPVAAISRLAKFYSNETYSAKPDRHEITDKANNMLDRVLGETGIKEIVDNPLIQSHFIVARAKGLNSSDNPILQSLGLATAALANSLSRKNLNTFFERFIFHAQNSQFEESYFQFDDLPTKYCPLNNKNVKPALIASGSIPMVLNGVRSIPTAESGVYRDGGIIDYHLDLDFKSEGLVIYPHFFPLLKPGWFDKGLKKRHAKAHNYDKVVLITPSPSHIASLPFNKISDRKDFTDMEPSNRIKYWQTVLAQSHRMADDFQRMVEQEAKLEEIIPIQSILS